MVASKPVTLIATLGGQPQVVTFALDTLLAQNVPVTELIVLYLTPRNPRIQRALTRLSAEFQDDVYQGRRLRYRPRAIYAGQRPLTDVHDETDANAVWETVNQLISQLKSERHTLHICISGGRRILGLLTMSAAMIHFAHQDVLWHMHTPDELREQVNEGAMMHLPPDSEFHLIRVPMLPWGTYFPALRQLTTTQLGNDVLAGPRQAMDDVEHTRCKTVVDHLTRRQVAVLEAFAQNKNPQEVAAHLTISIKTVDSHKTIILSECRNAWSIPVDTWLNYHFLIDKFELFFSN